MAVARAPIGGASVAVPNLARRSTVVPRDVRLVDGEIRWRVGQEGWREGGAATDAVRDFLGLATADDDEVFRFARRHGPLGIGVDGRPLAADGALPPTVEDADGNHWHAESVAVWRALSQHAEDVINLARALRKAQRAIDPERVLAPDGARSDPPLTFRWLGRAALVANLRSTLPPEPDSPTSYGRRPRPLPSQREWLAGFVTSTWVAYGGLQPKVTWAGDGFGIELGLGGAGVSAWPMGAVFPIIALAVASEVSGPPVARVCAWEGCGEVLPPRAGRGRGATRCERHQREAKLERGNRWWRENRGAGKQR